MLNESQIETKVTPLEFTIDLKPGESLIIAPNGTNDGVGDLMFGHTKLVGGHRPQAIDQKSELNRQIESAISDLDERLKGDSKKSGLEESDLGVADTTQPVTPLFRFLMIRLLYAQSGNALEADSSERLTTVNHD